MNVNLRTPLQLTIKDNTYHVKTPTAGQLWDVEEMKAVLANGRYGDVLNNRTVWAEYNLDNIDMFAYLSILVPQLMKDLAVNSWRELDPFDLAELKKAYKQQFVPWFEQFTKALRDVETKDEGENK